MRSIELLNCKNLSLFEKLQIIFAKINIGNHSKMVKIRAKYSKLSRDNKIMVLKTIFDYFNLDSFIALPFVKKNKIDSGEIIRCFFKSCDEIFYSNIYKLDQLLDDGDVIIDAGGNIGLFSLYAKNLRKDVSCIILEPEVRNFQALQKNLENYEHIFLFNKGLSNIVSQGELLISKNSLVHRVNSEEVDFDLEIDYNGVQKIELNTIDNIIFSKRLCKGVDLIKLDIEGSELMALKGAIKTIKNYNPLLLVAVEHSKRQERKIISFFKSNFINYSFLKLSSGNLLFYNPEKHSSRINKLINNESKL